MNIDLVLMVAQGVMITGLVMYIALTIAKADQDGQ